MADGSTSFSSPSTTIVSFSMAPRGRKPDSTAIDGSTSGGDDIHYRGVRKQRCGRRYGAEITDPSKKTRVWLGSFNTAEEAARAYDEAARSFHRDKAKTNFPLPTERRTTKSSQIAESSTVNQSSNNNSGGVPITILDTSLPYLRGFPMAHSQIDYLNLVELHGSYAPPPPNSTTAAVNCGPTNSDSSSVVNLSQPSSDPPQSGKAVTLEIDLNYPPPQVP